MTTPQDGTGRREGRGYIYSFGRDRSCAMSDCTTQLSRYNKTSYCWIHDEEMRTRRAT